MVKFSSEYREKVVLEYLNGGGGTHELAKKYGIGSHQTILDWVNRYKKYGDNSFRVRSLKSVYYTQVRSLPLTLTYILL